MLAESLFGSTVLTVGICFALGVFVAYLLWGIRYGNAVEAESTTVLLRQKAERLRLEHARLRKQLSQ